MLGAAMGKNTASMEKGKRLQKRRAVLPNESRQQAGIDPVGSLLCHNDDPSTLLENLGLCEQDDPFVTFTEWSSPEDDEAFRNL